MAFDALRPHQSQILGLLDQGRTLAQVIDVLAAQHGITTTPGTLSRFASSLRTTPQRRQVASPPQQPSSSPPELTPAQHARVDDIALKTELLAEIHASRQESRDILDHLAGKVAALSADITELEGSVDRNGKEWREHVNTAPPPGPHPHPVDARAVPSTVPAKVILRIWIRALVITGLLWAAIVVALLWRSSGV